MAKRRVDELVRSYIVFRNLTRPLGGVKSVPGTPYCVKGFFMQSDNGVFEFTPPSPLIQVRALSNFFYFHKYNICLLMLFLGTVDSDTVLVKDIIKYRYSE